MTTASLAERNFFDELQDRLGISNAAARNTLEFPSRGIQVELQGNDIIVRLEGRPPSWLLEFARRINQFEFLGPNWNSYGSRAVDPQSIVSALRALASIMHEDRPTPTVVPTVEGNLQLEWHLGGMDLEVVVEPRGPRYAYFADASGFEWEGEVSSDPNDLMQFVARLPKKL